jgi:Tfp pilus assembly protein FimT
MNSKAKLKRSRTSGFSTTELVIVIAIILIVAAIAIPNAIRVWYNMELRGTADQAASLMQEARILAAKNNTYYTVCYRSSGGTQQIYLTPVTLSSTAACTYTAPSSTAQGSITIDLARQISASSGAPTGTNPSAYTSSTDTSSGTPCDNTCTLAFSPRGLPCSFVVGTPGTCTTPAPTYFVYYFQATSSNGYAAILVTKAGRTRTFTWNGSSWN